MSARGVLAAVATLAAATQLCGQTVSTDPPPSSAATWRRAGEASAPVEASNAPAGQPAAASAGSVAASDLSHGTSRRGLTRVSNGNGSLPNQHGQVWREYDISPYTAHVTTTKRPELAIVDWILQETGYEAWNSEPLAVLSATPRVLRVYHTPQMQALVADLVERFVSSEAVTCTFSLRVATVDHPNWRAWARRLLRPVEVQTPGVSAWVMEKEDAAMLLTKLRRRSDYREHSSPHLMVHNGQSTVVSSLRSRSYVRNVALRGDAWPGFESQVDQLDEGFSLEFGPLLSSDGRMIDAALKCNIDQIEKMVPVAIEVPTQVAPRQRTKIEVPQLTHFRFHERFHWPVTQVLLVDMGMVALPVPVDAKPLVAGLPLPLGTAAPRANLLVFVEAKETTQQPPRVTRSPLRQVETYRGRY